MKRWRSIGTASNGDQDTYVGRFTKTCDRIAVDQFQRVGRTPTRDQVLRDRSRYRTRPSVATVFHARCVVRQSDRCRDLSTQPRVTVAGAPYRCGKLTAPQRRHAIDSRHGERRAADCVDRANGSFTQRSRAPPPAPRRPSARRGSARRRPIGPRRPHRRAASRSWQTATAPAETSPRRSPPRSCASRA